MGKARCSLLQREKARKLTRAGADNEEGLKGGKNFETKKLACDNRSDREGGKRKMPLKRISEASRAEKQERMRGRRKGHRWGKTVN